jgi:hypothetical protein
VGLKILCPPEPLSSELFFVDASMTWGIGLILDSKWLTWELKEGWKSDGRDIGWAEMVAVELAVRTLITVKYTNCHVIIHSDNMGVTGALTAGRSRGTRQNAILHEIIKLIQENNIWVSAVWISTQSNPADRPSRGLFLNCSSLYAFPPKIPFHLQPYVHKSVDYHDSRIITIRP